jgi:hypothetical protein
MYHYVARLQGPSPIPSLQSISSPQGHHCLSECAVTSGVYKLLLQEPLAFMQRNWQQGHVCCIAVRAYICLSFYLGVVQNFYTYEFSSDSWHDL